MPHASKDRDRHLPALGEARNARSRAAVRSLAAGRGWRRLAAALACAWALGGGAASALAQSEAEAGDSAQRAIDLDSVQGLLAIHDLDGWLLFDDDGQNPISLSIARPTGGRALHRWFYLIPADGRPTLVAHRADVERFGHLDGRRLVYGDRDSLRKQLKAALRGKKTLAMEYSPEAELPDLSRVDGGTLELVRAQGAKVRSSADLVQLAKSLWRPEQRSSHHVAVHHLHQLRVQALAFIGERLSRGQAVTERDVEELLQRGFEVRGLVGPRPAVATATHTADPLYAPLSGRVDRAVSARATPIRAGDLVMIDMAGRLADDERAVFARVGWVAYVGDDVPARFRKAFSAVADARDAAIALIRERRDAGRPTRGYEVDAEARAVLDRAGFADAILHRTGHSLDTDVHGGGVNFDDYGTRDSRTVMVGGGFAVAPGVYLDGEFGVRAVADIHIQAGEVEVTTPLQTEITSISVR
ncbi:M24 family metallopeptidase [Haliangium ochraceum]|uniref:Peptidase M24 n=1 Tax=Haliangium ochraceum (strain DSM 14365 / JCM 11303 / SMP-2) TaxID=502025 RepID=D0LJX5_HALO1|nr:M24 family metallopeptidase [Haliangium ochraceum]ACY18482.1 peptidase M24 [Haliangium ochraceum DSM 14365]